MTLHTSTLQHFKTPHCIVILRSTHSEPQLYRSNNITYMFSRLAAADVLPRSKNHGLKPSEDFFLMIR